MKTIASTLLSFAFMAGNALAQPCQYKMTTPTPLEITTPEHVDTTIGRLDFFDGVPTPDTAAKVYDQLDFSRGIEAFLNGLPGASMVAQRSGLRKVGAVDGTIGIFQDLMDSKSLFLTANTESIFWSVVLYDVQTRSMLQTDQQFPSLSSQSAPPANADRSVDVYFAPNRPEKTANWVQTIPGKSWFTIFRLYGPLEPWFDKSWRLPDIEEVPPP